MQVKMVFGEVLEKDGEGSENCYFYEFMRMLGFSCLQNIYWLLQAAVVSAEPTSSVTVKTNYESFLATKESRTNVEG